METTELKEKAELTDQMVKTEPKETPGQRATKEMPVSKVSVYEYTPFTGSIARGHCR